MERRTFLKLLGAIGLTGAAAARSLDAADVVWTQTTSQRLLRYVYSAQYSGDTPGIAKVMAGDEVIMFLPIGYANVCAHYDCMMAMPTLRSTAPLSLVGPGNVVACLYAVRDTGKAMTISDIISGIYDEPERIILTTS